MAEVETAPRRSAGCLLKTMLFLRDRQGRRGELSRVHGERAQAGRPLSYAAVSQVLPRSFDVIHDDHDSGHWRRRRSPATYVLEWSFEVAYGAAARHSFSSWYRTMEYVVPKRFTLGPRRARTPRRARSRQGMAARVLGGEVHRADLSISAMGLVASSQWARLYQLVWRGRLTPVRLGRTGTHARRAPSLPRRSGRRDVSWPSSAQRGDRTGVRR